MAFALFYWWALGFVLLILLLFLVLLLLSRFVVNRVHWFSTSCLTYHFGKLFFRRFNEGQECKGEELWSKCVALFEKGSDILCCAMGNCCSGVKEVVSVCV